MKLGIILTACALLLFAACLAVGAYALYKRAVCRRKCDTVSVWDKPFPDKPSKAEIKFGPRLTQGRRWLYDAAGRANTQSLEVISHDGLRLRARLIPCEEGVAERGVLFMLHGYHSDPIHEFGSCAESLSRLGFVLCLPSQRAHGDSEGKHLSYGINERLDVLAWTRLLSELYPNAPIILFGVSMGASSVLMASELHLPKNVRGIVADCGFTSPDEITKKVLRHDMRLPTFPLYGITELLVRAVAGFSFEDASALSAVSSARLPLMIVHGTDDAFVPYEMALRIREAATAPCLFLSGEGAGHGETFLMHSEKYLRTFEAFLRICGIS